MHSEPDSLTANNILTRVRENLIPDGSRSPSCVAIRHAHNAQFYPAEPTTFISLALPVSVQDVEFSTFIESMTKVESVCCLYIAKV